MKREKILTIGIPVYNMERYLRRCLESVTRITGLDKIDIIVVNDGSKDGSLAIAREFERRYPDSLRVIDKPNGGWGSAINVSIAAANGKYYKSLDSDDWFDSEGLDSYIRILQQVDADVVLSAYNTVNEAGEKTGGCSYEDMVEGKALPMEDYLIRNRGILNAPIHALTYRTALLQRHGVSIWERFYGDLDYICHPLVYAHTVFRTSVNVYQYFIGREGQSVSTAGYNKHLDDYISVVKKAISNKERYSDRLGENLRQLLFHESVTQTVFAYKLLMQPAYNGGKEGWRAKLKQFDAFLRVTNPVLYKAVGRSKVREYIPFIKIWRLLGLNVFLLNHNNQLL